MVERRRRPFLKHRLQINEPVTPGICQIRRQHLGLLKKGREALKRLAVVLRTSSDRKNVRIGSL